MPARRPLATAFRITRRLLPGLLGLLLAPALPAAEAEGSIARGGRLYDQYYAENKTGKPAAGHPSYPTTGGQYGTAASWRCVECHGWDYKGKDGAYAGGPHATGIKGIDAAAGKDPAAIAALLRDGKHGYDEKQLSAGDANDLALFVSKGQVVMAKYFDPVSKKAKGNALKGEVYFNTLCAACHGFDGKKIKDAPSLGTLADSPYEALHKLLNGQPAEQMPALRALDIQVALDLLSYLPQLPR